MRLLRSVSVDFGVDHADLARSFNHDRKRENLRQNKENDEEGVAGKFVRRWCWILDMMVELQNLFGVIVMIFHGVIKVVTEIGLRT
jgi:hypothetical protein